MTTAYAAPYQTRISTQPEAPLHFTYEARQQAALHQHATQLKEAATQRLLREHCASSWWSRLVVWQPVQFILRIPGAILK